MIGGRAQPPGRNMSETAAVGFLTSLEVLPKALGLTAGVAALGHGAVVPEGVRGLSGAEYKQRVVSRLFRARWPGAVSVGMCQVLRDLDLDEGQLKVAVGRVLRHLRKNAKLHDLPALTYQLLLLAGRYALRVEYHHVCAGQYLCLLRLFSSVVESTLTVNRSAHLMCVLSSMFL